jgi:hypothetical protein
MASTDKGDVPYLDVMRVAWLSGSSDDGADPFVNLCHIGLQLE